MAVIVSRAREAGAGPGHALTPLAAFDRVPLVVAELFDDDFLVDPYPAYAYLRESGRLIRTDLFGGAWLMPRFDDIMSALRDPILSADRSKVPVNQLPPEVRADYADWNRLFGMWLLFKDPPRHTRMRKLLNHSFTPRVLTSWRPRIEEITNDLIDNIRGRQNLDWVTEFAYELPATVVAEMLGVREGDREQFVEWSMWVGIFFGTPEPSLELANSAQDGLVKMAAYFADLIPERRANPGDDILSILIGAEEEGEQLTEDEVLSQMTLFLFAGLDTTKNMMGSGLLGILERPDQRDLIESDAAVMRTAVSEMLRFDSPIQFLHRSVAHDGELAGQKVAEGDTVVLLVGCANRDAERFTKPHNLDLARNEGNNLAFGFGPHFCLGAPLTFLEGEIAFPAIIEALPDIELVSDEPDWDPINPGFRNLKTLYVNC